MSDKCMDCRDFGQFAEFYLDHELGDRERQDMESHVLECEGCAARLRSMSEAKTRLKASAALCPASAAMKARFEASLREHRIGGEAAPTPRQKTPWLVAAAALLAVGAGTLWRSSEGGHVRELVSMSGGDGIVLPAALTNDPLVSQAADWHRRNVPVEVTGPSNGAVANWFADKVDFPVRVPEFGNRATLLGGRMTTVGNKPAALLVYDVDGTKLSVLVSDENHAPTAADASRSVGGRSIYLDNTSTPYSVAFERKNGLTYSYTSDLRSEDLVQLVSAER